MLTAGISTSSGQFALVIGEKGNVLFDSSEAYGDNEHELNEMLSAGLESCHKKVKEISRIVVDIGPGGTSRVRTGIAFANALAYSLGISVYPVTSMELAGVDAGSKYGLPVIYSVKSIKGNAYIGLYHHHLRSIQFGNIHDIVPLLVSDIDEFVVAGFHREAIVGLASLKNKRIINSLISFGDAKLLIEKSDLFMEKPYGFPVYAQPVTEKTI